MDLQVTNVETPSTGTVRETHKGYSPSHLSNLVWGEVKSKADEEETNLPEATRGARAQLVTPEAFDEGSLTLRPTAAGRLASRAARVAQEYGYPSEPAALTLFKLLASMRGVASFWDTMFGKDDDTTQ
ncbi:hypothetical protein IAR50_005683 [Cryptococcus sp. DSM 104548]